MPEIQIPPVNFSVVLQPAIIFGWSLVVLMVDLFIPQDRKRITGYLALFGIIAAIVAGIPSMQTTVNMTLTFSDMIALDNFALILNMLFLVIAAITILISLDYLPRHGIERGEYHTLILFATGGMMLLSQGTDLIVLFLGLELLSITLYILAGFAYPRLASEEAAMKYLLIGAFAAGFLVFGIALIFGGTGTSNLVAIANLLAEGSLSTEDNALLLIGTALIIVGFGYKIAMAPFHMWTPDVYEGAPTPVTAFMSVGTKSAGFAALARILLLALPSNQEIWVPVLAVLAAITMLIGNISAIAQVNVKRMLAYSSIGHAGFILMGILANNDRGVEGLIFYLIAYSLTNLAAFAVLIALEKRGEALWDMSDFAGLWQRQPFLAGVMAICMLSLAGFPPTAGFIAKFYVFIAAWETGLQWLVLVGIVASAISAFFYLRIISQMFMNEPTREIEARVDANTGIGLGLATFGVILFGILPALIINLIQQSSSIVSR
ncbi:MAG: NADH-quinone oxidoreductase subunit N [Chloroflexota bacterium]